MKRGTRKNNKPTRNVQHVEVDVRSSGGRRKGGSGGRRRGASVSTAFSKTTSETKNIRLFGTDRMAHIPDVSGKTEGSVLISTEISCESFARLKHFGDAFQRVKFHKLRFRVVPMSATSNNGGYIAAFVADASDDFGSGPNSINRLAAQQGAKITKIWEEAVISHKCVPDLLYTSEPPGGDIRFASPGRLVVAIESQVSATTTQKIPMTVYCDWTVEFSEPSLEGSPEKVSGTVTAANAMYSRNKYMGIWADDKFTDPRTNFPGVVADQKYKLQNSKFLGFPEQAGSFDTFILQIEDVENARRYAMLPVGFDGKAITEGTDKNYWVIEKGDRMTPVFDAKNLRVGQEYLFLPGSAPDFEILEALRES